jgi:hypothetical protein
MPTQLLQGREVEPGTGLLVALMLHAGKNLDKAREIFAQRSNVGRESPSHSRG